MDGKRLHKRGQQKEERKNFKAGSSNTNAYRRNLRVPNDVKEGKGEQGQRELVGSRKTIKIR